MSKVENPFPQIFKKKLEHILKREIQEENPIPKSAQLEAQLKQVERAPALRPVKYNINFNPQKPGTNIKVEGNLNARDNESFDKFVRNMKLIIKSNNLSTIEKSLDNLLQTLNKVIPNMSQELLNIMYQFISKLNKDSRQLIDTLPIPYWINEYINKQGLSRTSKELNRSIIAMDNIENLIRDNLRLPKDLYKYDEIAVPAEYVGPAVGSGKMKKHKIDPEMKKKIYDLMNELLNY